METTRQHTDSHRLTRAERLRGETRIERLFSEGRSFVVYPFRVVYRQEPLRAESTAALMTSIPKKKFKRAVKRNLLRRRVKEAFRLNKTPLNTRLETLGISLDMAILYLDKELLPYTLLASRMQELLGRLGDKVAASCDSPAAGCQPE